MKSNFDLIAPFYDLLARFVFGKSIVRSQTSLLGSIPPKAKVLILGGGTGWILEALVKQNSTCEVWYIDASSKMISRARQRKTNDQVYFIYGTEKDIPKQIQFDVIITNFFLDLFSESELKETVSLVTCQSHVASTWLVTDFVNNNVWWQRLMLKVMYWFFKRISGISTTHLPDWSKQLTEQWEEKNSKLWYGGFINSSAWLRKS